MNREYAREIAQGWNTRDAFSGYCGVVVMFEVETDYLTAFEIHNVGNEQHNELWIPGAEVASFNEHIAGHIWICDVFLGAAFERSMISPIKKMLLDFINT
jgi:hypothetical protein